MRHCRKNGGMPPSDLLSTGEAIELLNVSRRTIHRWVEDGRLPIVHKMPGRLGAYVFRRADVEKLAGELVPVTRMVHRNHT